MPKTIAQKRAGLADVISTALKSVCGPKAVLHEPCFGGNENVYTKECLDTGWVSSAGKYVDLFERRLAEITGSKFAIATVNGTAALHMCLRLAGVTQGDEVLMPALTFVATANAAVYEGAIPHFLDSDEKSLGIDPLALADRLKKIVVDKKGQCANRITGRPIRALVVVHGFGHPADLDALEPICAQYGIALIEDAAESLGSLCKGRHTGLRGLLSALSFNGNKIITTGGGGAILTQNEVLAKKAKHVTTTAKRAHPWRYDHDEIGFNYRLPNINAAIGVAQLERLDEFVRRKRALAEKYQRVFSDLPGARFFMEPSYARSNYWLNALLLNRAEDRDPVLATTNSLGLMTRPAWTLLNELPMFKKCPKAELRQSESIASRLINIPSSAFLAEDPQRPRS
jgi:perosamine synthetase